MTAWLRTIFCINRIYRRTSPRQIMVIYAYIFFGLLIARQMIADRYPFAYQMQIFNIVLVVYIFFLLRTITRTAIVSRRISSGTALDPINQSLDPVVMHSATYAQYTTKHDESQVSLNSGQGWKLYDLVFSFWSDSRLGRYVAKELYYTVFDGKLVREVPHILFDSKTAHHQQFSSMYAHAQRLSLEGDFDRYFDTYVPQAYKIDSLSFITPEVMELLVSAKNYDIELVDDRLLLIGPLTDKSDLDAMQALGQQLTASFNDNLDTYKDDRLVGASRATEVTPFARTLVHSMTRQIIATVFVAGLFGFTIFQSITDNHSKTLLVVAGIYFVILLIAIGSMLITAQKNKQAIRAAMLDSDHQKPQM